MAQGDSVKPLAGRTALVTGASHGIGLGCAEALARDGATVVMMGRTEASLEQARTDLAHSLPEARLDIFVGDACEEPQIQAGLAYAHSLTDRLDILVPVVGGPTFKPLLMLGHFFTLTKVYIPKPRGRLNNER